MLILAVANRGGRENYFSRQYYDMLPEGILQLAENRQLFRFIATEEVL